jgi:hypothetical protein
MWMLTSDDIALVRATFARVAPMEAAAADLFYDRLFMIAPQLRPLFFLTICATRSAS